MARIDSFRAFLTQGGARPTQFRVELVFPNGIGAETAGAGIAGTFMCTAASLPGSLLSSIDIPYRGRMVKIAGERQFQNWQVRILNDGDFIIRKAMESWSSKILQHGDTAGVVTPIRYTADLQVVQLDRNEIALRTYKFHNCFPTNISEINLDFGDTQSIENFNVEFSVDYWTVESGAVQIR